MFIYLLLIIPIAFTILCLFKYKHEVVWWEYLLNFGISFICIFASKAIIEHTQVTDTEYWGGWVTEARYYEDWNEYIEQTCESTCCCDSKGNNCQTTYYDCSYVDYHPEYWEAHGSNKEKVEISKQQYYDILNKFKTKQLFVDLGRDYHDNDGDMYRTNWNNQKNTLEPFISKHSYENRVRVSSSTYAMQEPPKEIFEEYNLYHYPKIYDKYKQRVVLGLNDPIVEKEFQYLNAKWGSKKQFKTYVMLFKNQPREAGLYQEEQWQGGNKNELNITIGLDDQNKVLWSHVFSWTDKRDIVTNVKTFIEDQDKLDLLAVVDKLDSEIPKNWYRKEFSEFSYLTVEPKASHIFIAFIVTFLVNLGVTIFVISNDITENKYNNRRFYG